jgi:hypothetical protein
MPQAAAPEQGWTVAAGCAAEAGIGSSRRSNNSSMADTKTGLLTAANSGGDGKGRDSSSSHGQGGDGVVLLGPCQALLAAASGGKRRIAAEVERAACSGRGAALASERPGCPPPVACMPFAGGLHQQPVSVCLHQWPRGAPKSST